MEKILKTVCPINNDDVDADITSHDTFEKGFPHMAFKRMRDDDPCAWVDEKDGGKGFWAVTRYNDIREVNGLPKIFSSAQGIRLEEQSKEEFEARKTFQETDPPIHTRQRMMFHRGFTRKLVSTYEPLIREICNDILNDAVDLSEVDATKEIAKKLPMRMLGRVVGTPDEDAEWLVSRGDAMIANSDPDFTDHVIDKVDTDEYRFLPFRSPAGKEIYDYGEKQKKLRENHNMGDVMSMLLQPDKQGDKLSDLEFKNFFALMVAAGNDTTRYTMASSMHALANNPYIFDYLKSAPDDAPIWLSATEEFIRWASPTMHFRRTATEDYKLHNKKIKEGDKVAIWFTSGNYDERKFSNPFSFDLERENNQHIAFGQGGPHTCLGMWLARLEVRVAMQELLKRVLKIEQIGPEKYLRSNFIRGIKNLPVRLTSA